MAKAKNSKSKPVKLQQDYILLDRSGSMASRWGDTLGGVNAYVHALAKDKATADILVTVQVFDTHGIDVVRRSVSASEWKDIGHNEVSPRGGTPLDDALGRLVTSATAMLPRNPRSSSLPTGKRTLRTSIPRLRRRGFWIVAERRAGK